jgi:hypothetical protein
MSSVTNSTQSDPPVRNPKLPYTWINDNGVKIQEPALTDRERGPLIQAMFPSSYIFSKGKTRGSMVTMTGAFIDERFPPSPRFTGCQFRWGSRDYDLRASADFRDVLKTAVDFGTRLEEDLKREHAEKLGLKKEEIVNQEAKTTPTPTERAPCGGCGCKLEWDEDYCSPSCDLIIQAKERKRKEQEKKKQQEALPSAPEESPQKAPTATRPMLRDCWHCGNTSVPMGERCGSKICVEAYQAMIEEKGKEENEWITLKKKKSKK